MESENELKRARTFHEEEVLRLRQVAEDALKEAEKHASRVQAYDVVLSDLPSVRANFAEQLRLGIEDAQEEEEEEEGLDLQGSTGKTLAELARITLGGLEKGSKFSGPEIQAEIEKYAPGFLATLEPKALTKVLWSLAKVGEIERVQGGQGRKPAIYRIPI
jgi:hypothetical protein